MFKTFCALISFCCLFAISTSPITSAAVSDGSNSFNAFGTPDVLGPVAPGAPYIGLSSSANSVINGGVNTMPLLGTTARIINGTNATGTAESIVMQWRNRTDLETSVREGGNPSDPPLPCRAAPLISDALRVSGMNSTAGGQIGDRTQTDPYVLAISYDPSLMVDPTNGFSTEYLHAQGQRLRMVSFDTTLDGNNSLLTTNDRWLSAHNMNFYGSGESAYFAGLRAYDSNVDGLTVGRWGVDIDNNEVWAVLNYTGDFAVIPEPSTYAVGVISVAALCVIRRRRQAKAASENLAA